MITPILKSHDGDKKTARPLTPIQTPPGPDKPSSQNQAAKESLTGRSTLSQTPEEKKSKKPPHSEIAPQATAPPATSKTPVAASIEPAPSPTPMIHQLDRVRALAQMAEVTANGIEHFLATFRHTISPDGTLIGVSRAQFFQTFVAEAEKLAAKPSGELAAIFRTHSVRADVRMGELAALGKDIRGACFAELDGIVLSCVTLLKTTDLDLSGILNQLVDSPLSAAALRVRANQPPPDSPPDENRQPGGAVTLPAPVRAEPGNGPLLEKQGQAKSQGQALAFLKIVDYLRSLSRLPAALLDCGSAKCFGGDVDAGLHKKVLWNIQGLIEPKLTQAIELVLNVASAETIELERLKEAETTRANAGEELKARKAWHEAQGIGFLAFSGICLFPAWVAVLNGSLTGTLNVLVVGAGIVGCLSFFWGITQMTLSRGAQSTDPDPATKSEVNLSNPPEESPDVIRGKTEHESTP